MCTYVCERESESEREGGVERKKDRKKETDSRMSKTNMDSKWFVFSLEF